MNRSPRVRSPYMAQRTHRPRLPLTSRGLWLLNPSEELQCFREAWIQSVALDGARRHYTYTSGLGSCRRPREAPGVIRERVIGPGGRDTRTWDGRIHAARCYIYTRMRRCYTRSVSGVWPAPVALPELKQGIVCYFPQSSVGVALQHKFFCSSNEVRRLGRQQRPGFFNLTSGAPV